MSDTTKKTVILTESALETIEKRLNALFSDGIIISSEHTTELNFNGCARGYCQAWA